MKFLLLLFLFFSVNGASEPTQLQKQKYLYPLGKKIFQKECHELGSKHFDSFDALQHYIHIHCDLQEQRYEDALAWYLWDTKAIAPSAKKAIRFHYTKKDKCPVCGMFVYKYPKWVVMIRDAKERELYFDGVKDMLKYYFTHEKDDLKLYAQDYYSKKIINLHDSWLVFSSDVYGPMGEEIIPFASKKEAQSFLLDHHGKRIVKLHQLDKTSIEALDE